MFKQLATAIGLALRTIPSRRGTSLVIVISMACAVGALVSIQSMSTGFTQLIHNNGRPDRAIVLSRSSIFESVSSLPRSNADVIADAEDSCCNSFFVENRRCRPGHPGTLAIPADNFARQRRRPFPTSPTAWLPVRSRHRFTS